MPRGSRRHRKRKQTVDEDGASSKNQPTIEEWSYGETSHNKAQMIPPPFSCMDDIPLPHCEIFRAAGIEQPTNIQKYVWPILLLQKEQSLILLAPTASGKTFTYGGIFSPMLILVPTRELAIQVQNNLQLLHKTPAIALYGGRSDRQEQRKQLLDMSSSSKCIIAATPGRLLDLLELKQEEEEVSVDVVWKKNSTIETIVLDEADRLAMDASLKEQVSQILKLIIPNNNTTTPLRRIILASATWPEKVSSVWHDWLQHIPTTPLAIRANQVPNVLQSTQIPPRIQQVLHVCSDHKRRKKLVKTLEKEQHNSGIIFFATIQELKQTGTFLRKQYANVTLWHGQLSQDEREKIQLQKPPFMILATDVAARGIHNEHISYIVNYDFPSNLEQYVHRCGRIRASGTCYSFFLRKFKALAKDLVTLLQASQQTVDPNLLAMAVDGQSKKQRVVTKKVETKSGDDYDDDEDIDPFPEISGQRIVLKRAENVSDPSSSDDDDDDDGDDDDGKVDE